MNFASFEVQEPEERKVAAAPKRKPLIKKLFVKVKEMYKEAKERRKEAKRKSESVVGFDSIIGSQVEDDNVIEARHSVIMKAKMPDTRERLASIEQSTDSSRKDKSFS